MIVSQRKPYDRQSSSNTRRIYLSSSLVLKGLLTNRYIHGLNQHSIFTFALSQRRVRLHPLIPIRKSKSNIVHGCSWEVSGAQSGCAVRSGGDLPGKAVGALSIITY